MEMIIGRPRIRIVIYGSLCVRHGTTYSWTMFLWTILILRKNNKLSTNVSCFPFLLLLYLFKASNLSFLNKFSLDYGRY